MSEIGNSHVKIRAKGNEIGLWNRDTDGKEKLGNEMDESEKKTGRRARPQQKIREEEKIHNHDLGDPERKWTLLGNEGDFLYFSHLLHERGW